MRVYKVIGKWTSETPNTADYFHFLGQSFFFQEKERAKTCLKINTVLQFGNDVNKFNLYYMTRVDFKFCSQNPQTV